MTMSVDGRDVRPVLQVLVDERELRHGLAQPEKLIDQLLTSSIPLIRKSLGAALRREEGVFATQRK